MTDAEIAGYMGWRGPGAYTKATMRKVKAVIAEAVAREREACAQECLSFISEVQSRFANNMAEQYAEAIRNRGKS